MTNTEPFMEPARQGSSMETAVVVRTLWAEYVWIDQHLPSWPVVRHGVARQGERTFDVLRLQAPDGEMRDIYFDISGCFGNRSPQTPPCPYCGAPLVTAKARQCRRCFADFHDPDHIVYRKGREHVDRVRSGRVEWEDSNSETRSLELKNPVAAFATRFGLKRVSNDVALLRFPPLSAHDERLFRIGIESLRAMGCRGFVCDLDQPMREVRGQTTDGSMQMSRLLAWILAIPYSLVGVVLLRGEDFARRLPYPVRLENFETEERAVAALTSRLASSGLEPTNTRMEPPRS